MRLLISSPISGTFSISLYFIEVENRTNPWSNVLLVFPSNVIYILGLYAPHWQPMARGALVGMNQYTYGESILKAAMESVSFQSLDILEVMRSDSKARLDRLKVDGYLSMNKTIMQSLSNITNARVEVATSDDMAELGVAMAAGYTADINVWNALCMSEDVGKTYMPEITVDEREEKINGWKKAVRSSFNWIGFKKPKYMVYFTWTAVPIVTGALLLGVYSIIK